MDADARKTFLLRIDPRLWRELKAWADAEMRSVNGQIEFILREAVAKRKKRDPLDEPRDAGGARGARH